MNLSVLLPYQSKVYKSTEIHDVTVVEKSRRTGLSWGASFKADDFASLMKKSGGMDVFYIGYNLQMSREFIDYCAEHAKFLQVAASEVHESYWRDPEDEEKDIKIFRIDFQSGFKIQSLPSRPRSLRGMQGFVIIDEAAFHDDLEELIKAAMALLMWGGKVLIISTHNGDQNYFNDLVQDIRAGRKPYNLIRVTLDDALEDGLYKRICKVSGKKWSQSAQEEWREDLVKKYGSAADEELFCIPSQGKGAYLPLALIEARQESDIPIIRWGHLDVFALWSENLRWQQTNDFFQAEILPVLEKLDPKEPICFGGDFGRSGDLSVFWFLGITKTLKTPTRFVVELRNTPFENQKQILHAILEFLGSRFRAGKMDGRGNGQYLAEVTVQKFASKVEAVMISESWYRDNMPRMKAAFEDDSITVPKDREIQDDLRSLQMIKGVARVPEQRTSGESGKRHGDGAIALCMAVAATKADVLEYGYIPVPNPHDLPGNLQRSAMSDRMTGEELARMEDVAEGHSFYGIRGSLI